MKKTIFMIFAASAACALLLASCEKDPIPTEPEEPQEPEPVEVTVSLHEVYGESMTVTLNHDRNGVTGTADFDFRVNLSTASESDVTVSLTASCEGISQNRITITPSSVTIPAGSFRSEVVNLSITDWSELDDAGEEATEYTLTISISQASVPVEERASLNLAVNKPLQNYYGENFLSISSHDDLVAAGYTRSYDNSSWTFEFWSLLGNALENAESNALIGNSGSDIAVDMDLINFIVDFNEVKAIGGFFASHWGVYYSPYDIRLSESPDGVNWRPLGEVRQGYAARIYLAFQEVVHTRYLKYEQLNYYSQSGRIDITGTDIYVVAE